MKAYLKRLILPLVFVGACSFPRYAFMDAADPCADGAQGQDETGVDCGGSCDACPDTCEDGVQGPNETGVDCGGVCDACPGSAPVQVCSDGMQGPNETSIDCGGLCPACAAGGGCDTDDDCASAHCEQKICQAAKCNDSIRNGTESDIDCGGACPVLCKALLRCTAKADCASGSCSAGTCQKPSCVDHITNGSETDLDCGGGSCPLCGLGSSCASDSDCASMNCDVAQLVCVNEGCTNKLKNDDETDIDCGGASCAPCAATKHCKQNGDCDSSVCNTSGVCVAASCTDAVLNQTESDTDCGGGACPPCAISHKCLTGLDCASSVCQAKLCLPKMPTGSSIGTSGWSATASNTFGDSTTKNLYDGNDKIRWTTGARQAAGMFVRLDLGAPQIFFSVRLDSGDFPNDAGKSYNIFFSTDGSFGEAARREVTGTQTFAFENAIVARYIKIELAVGGTNWWSIGEIEVHQ